MDDSWDDSGCYFTTYSEDEELEKHLKEQKELQKAKEQQQATERKEYIKELWERKGWLYQDLPGLKIYTFRPDKMKFSFTPSEVVNLVRKSVIFYVSLRYNTRWGYWSVKRDSVPVDYKLRIAQIFTKQDTYIEDQDVWDAIERIYDLLMDWAEKEELFRRSKFERYKRGSDVELDSDDEELFLTPEERMELHERKTKILRRMLWPDGTSRLRPRPKRT